MIICNLLLRDVPLIIADGDAVRQDRFWRKNRAYYNATISFSRQFNRTCLGIDLNRNFDYQWGTGKPHLDSINYIHLAALAVRNFNIADNFQKRTDIIPGESYKLQFPSNIVSNAAPVEIPTFGLLVSYFDLFNRPVFFRRLLQVRPDSPSLPKNSFIASYYGADALPVTQPAASKY